MEAFSLLNRLGIRRKNTSKKQLYLALSVLAGTSLTTTVNAAPIFSWTTVVNNADIAPLAESNQENSPHYFFSYNQPSINDDGLVVFRARAMATHGAHGTGALTGTAPSSSGEGGVASGIFTRDMSVADSPVNKIAVRGDIIPGPNNITKPGPSTFNEFPSFPRIDASSSTLAFRGQSKPSWMVTLSNGDATKSGTSGVYYSSGDSPQTGIRNIESEGGFLAYLVPETTDTRFEQFPGAPSPSGNLITFKGNWSDSQGNSMTGVFYRDITSQDQAEKIAQRGDSIPIEALPSGTSSAQFGSTAPPSAAAGKVVFTGLDNEGSPTAGGIFMADLTPSPTLKTVAGFNTAVPTYSPETTLNNFGEGLSFDGRYVGFWAGWGEETITRTVNCGSDGCHDLLDYCTDNSPNVDGIYNFKVQAHQGIFLADTMTEQVFLVAETGEQFEDFLFWNYAGKIPENGGGHHSEGGKGESEGPRWRSSAYLAIDGDNVFFKALLKDGNTSGIFGALNVTSSDFGYDKIFPLLTTGMDGGVLDPRASGLSIVSLGIERDGFRNGQLAITASMADDENSWSGIYVTTTPVPEPSTMLLLSAGLAGLAAASRRKNNNRQERQIR